MVYLIFIYGYTAYKPPVRPAQPSTPGEPDAFDKIFESVGTQNPPGGANRTREEHGRKTINKLGHKQSVNTYTPSTTTERESTDMVPFSMTQNFSTGKGTPPPNDEEDEPDIF
uniref:Uncharacterized protein n=1 Tax=Aplanochytrium stocchinoi TaxID=215587 RepID=A0A7S3LS48_9STRA